MHLRFKVLSGFLGMILLISSMVAVLLVEHQRISEIEKETKVLRYIRKNINKVHRSITELATLGETVISWTDNNYEEYQSLRIKTDKQLKELKLQCYNIVQVDQIDSLCSILESKELHLRVIMDFFFQQKNIDSILVNQLLVSTKDQPHIRTVTRKKKGLAGWFGITEKINLVTSDTRLEKQNDKLIERFYEQKNSVELYADSLRIRNKELNIRLCSIINLLDKQAHNSFYSREEKIMATQIYSLQLFSIIFILSIILLLVSFFIICRDLKKEDKRKLRLKEIIKENENLLEMRKKIILTVSHDIRGPLGNIHNCADLASETKEKRKREIYLQDIRYSCNHILHLVNDLMDAYRINEAGELRNDTPFYIDCFLRRISDDFSRKANTKGLIFYTEHEKTSLTVKGDADKLEQVLTNLLTNAIKFTPSGSVRFHSQYFGSKLRIEIGDTGIGMDKETLKRVFSPFERAAQNINSEGFGLGLFLTKGLVKVLDGTMEVESEPGKGTVFRLEFPLPETEEIMEQDNTDNNLINTLPKKVLVVDDDPIQLKIAEDMLGRKGITCKTCINVQEVVAAFEQSNYDVVLTDLQMPGTDGFGLLKLLRNSDMGNSRVVPVAVMTARGDGNNGIYEKEGFVGCIHKPFNIRRLLAFLSTVITKEVHSEHSNFNFTELLKDTEDKGYILSLVLSESKRELDELELAIKTTDRESMRKTVHRMVPVWEMLGKDCLLREFQKVLHDNNCSDETVCEHTRGIMKWIVKLIEETKKKLNRYENTDS